jgi:cytochrome c1
VNRYRELAEQHPGIADPEYVAWLSQEGRAEAWVANFDLGPEFTEKHRIHAEKQRWIPEDAYAVEFDTRKLKDGNFAWHPKKGGCWAKKEDAQRYALRQWEDNNQPPERNCFWAANARDTSVPLYCVARVLKVGEVSHMGDTLVEIAFDYGTEWMRDGSKRKAIAEAQEKAGLRVLTKDEYESLLPAATQFFKEAEEA